MASDRKGRLLRLIRRRHPNRGKRGGALDDGALWLAHDRATEHARMAEQACQSVATGVAKQRASLDTGFERARAAAAKTQELTATLARVSEAFDRLGLAALNAGLEGARQGEGGGRALSLFGDEVREQSGRGGEAARDVQSTLAELAGDLAQIGTYFERAREASADVTQDVARGGGATSDVQRALDELADGIRKVTGSNPEAVKAMAQATEHARALVASLGAISGKVPRSVVMGTLRPVLEPLARLLDEDDGSDEDEA